MKMLFNDIISINHFRPTIMKLNENKIFFLNLIKHQTM